ncbi:hypothetical protein WMY93_017785 [Mugilogobius chulae]|uniref:Rho GTPase activating protein 32a n=1 Tax=Mugilogobius chulae TaxID=88201 RepID=A0AAW0NRY9_9GOBI
MEAGCVVAAVIENAASEAQGEPGSGEVLGGDVLPCSDPDKSEESSQAANNNPLEEKQVRETSSALVPTDDITEHPEPLLRSCVSTASMKVKNMKKLTFPKGHFPKLAECAHFHYETVDFGSIQLVLKEDQNEGPKANVDSKELVYLAQITCQGKNWLVKRSYEDFRVLDKHLHLCIYDRRFSQLTELPKFDPSRDSLEVITKMLAAYLSRFTIIADNKINCGPVLTWMEIDNKGNHLLVSEESSINVPAIAAAHVTKRYTAQANDELTFEVGDIISVIDMPPKEDTGWWRGKHGFQVGFFPCDCVELINDKIPPSVQSSVPKPVCKKHGKLVTFLRTFMKSRPPPQKLRQRGILRERVFGCDLGEHLHNSGHDVPQVVQSCAEFIEKNGVVDGIYRLSGISSNIQKLRHEFDSEQVPDLTRDNFRQDIHSVGSLCKLYFRELPNPLLTYQLYDRFAEAVSAATDEERLVKIYNVIQQLPPPHYRTLEFLMRHLSRLATFSSVTSMHTKNLAIVWAPNLLRSRQIESACFSGTAAFMEVRIQSVVVEFILNNTEALFSQKINAIIRENNGNNTLVRPKSLLVCSPSTKLLSLEEAQARTQAQLGSPATTPCLSHSDYIEVGEGPEALLGKFHTVIDLPLDNLKRAPVKSKKSPVGNWLSFFHLGKSHSVSKRKLKRHPSEPNEMKSIALPGGRGDTGTLRSTKSEESLASLHNIDCDPHSYRHLRPRSTSEAISAAVSKDDLRSSRSKEELRPHSLHAPASIPYPQEDDLDLSPPAVGISTLDFDPMSFQCSKSGSKWRKSAGCSSESEPISSPNNNIDEFSPDLSPGMDADTKRVLKSPKLRKKSFKTQADVQNSSMAFGSSTSPSPCTPSPLDDRCDVSDGKQHRPPYAHCSPISTVSHASDLPDPGTDRLMSSVSVLPPHPPLMSAARKLALALAESAQRASGCPQRRNTYTPPHPLLLPRQDAPLPHGTGLDRPARPSMLDLKVYLQEQRGNLQASSSGHSPAKSHRYPPPAHFLPAHLRPELATDGQESSSNFTPNVSPLGSGSLDESRDDLQLEDTPIEPTYQSVGVSTPTQPVCPTQSPLTSPVYVNTDSINVFNFRAVLAETSMPTSIEQVLPRPLHRHYSAEEDTTDDYGYLIQTRQLPRCPPPEALPIHLQKSIYRQSSEGHYSALASRYPLSPQNRRYYKDEHVVSGFQRSNSQQQRSDDRVAGQPAIRRARSFHAPQISHYELAETEIMPPDTIFYVEAPTNQDTIYSRLIETGWHPPSQLESDQQHKRYQGDSSQYYAEPCQPTGIRHSQSYTLHSTRESEPSDYYAQPVNRELFIEHDTVVYEARDSEVYERVVYQPYCRDRGKSPFDSAGSRNRDIMHTRSKSDPGNAYLLCADRMESVQAATSPTSPLSQQSEPEVSKHQVSYRPNVEPSQTRRIHIKESSAALHKVPSLPERACPNLKNVEHKSHKQGYNQDPLMMAKATSYSGILKPGILRRPGRSQSTRENRPHQYQIKSPLDPEHPGSFSQSGRRTQSYKVRPTQHDFTEGYYVAPRSKPMRTNKALAGFVQGQSCMTPNRHRLLSKALGREGYYLRSEGGVYD